MIKKNIFRIFYLSLLFWAVVTLFVEQERSRKGHKFQLDDSPRKALVTYSPDLFYNFDEQICMSFAEGLIEKGWSVDVLSTKEASGFTAEEYSLFGLCANTYNWAPDWSIIEFLETHDQLEGKPIVAITLGGGSTARAQRKFEEKIKERNGLLLRSESFWLMRPNDEQRMDESNVQVGLDQAKELGLEIGKHFEEQNLVTSQWEAKGLEMFRIKR